MEQHSINKDTDLDMDVNDVQDVSMANMNESMGWDSEQYTDKSINDDWKLINSEEETEKDDWVSQIIPKERRNIGSPLIVDLYSVNSETSPNVSGTFEQKQETKSSKNIFYTDNAVSEEKDICITVSESINPDEVISKIAKQASSNQSPSKSGNHNYKNLRSNCRRENAAQQHNSIIEQQHNSITDQQHNSAVAEEHVAIREPQVYCIRNMVIVIMENKSRLCFTGKLLVKVLFGAVQIYGFVLNRSTDATKVYSPRGYSNVAIETSEMAAEGSIEDVWTALAARDITRDSESQLQMDIDSVQPGAAILVLQNFENGLTRFLKTHFPSFRLFPNINNPCYYSWMDPKRAEIVLQANLHLQQHESRNYRRLITDSFITMKVAEKMLSNWRANEWSCTLIAGGKSVGKSTSVRYLINSLLRTSGKVVLVDVDPGQTECTPAGCISYSLIEEPLMGPNFTHLKTPVYQLYLDDVNVTRCLMQYLECIKMLIERLQQCPILSRLPIVVNTMGYTMYLGWDIAVFTIKLIRPTIILQIMSSFKKKNYVDFLSALVINNQKCTWMCCDETFIDWFKPCKYDFYLLQSHAENYKDEWNMEPYQQRDLVMISYLSGIMCNNDDSLQYNTELSFNINKVVPYTAPFSSLCVIPQRSFGVPVSRILNVINGNIVALCGIDLTEKSSQEFENTSGLRVLTQRPSLCTCYGFGIIRGIDTERQEVFINTPLPVSIMQHINCLAGCIPVPPALLQLNQGAPYVGGNASLPTSREIRRGVFRMKPKMNSHKKLDSSQ